MSTTDIEEIKGMLQKQGQQQERLMSLIVGNEYDEDDKGMLGDIKDLGKRVATVEELQSKWKYTFAGFTFSIAVLVTGVQILINYISRH